MSGAIQVAVKPPMASPIADQPAPWDTKDVEWEAKRLAAVEEVQRLQREGKRSIAREELSKLREKYKGTPAEAGYAAMLALDDYSGALDAHIKQLRDERLNGPEPVTPDPEPADTQQHAAWVGGGGPLIHEGDAAQEYAATNQAANDDAATQAMWDAYDAENPPEAGAGPEGGAQLKAPDLPVGAAAKPRGGADPVTQGGARNIHDLIAGRPKTPTLTGDPLHDAGVIATDVGVGLVTSPHAVVIGVRNGINELAGSIDSAGAWAATQAMLVEGDTAGAAKLAARRASGETALENQLPSLGEVDTTTGKLIEGITQFVTGFVAGGKVLKAAGFGGAGYGASLLKGAFSDAFAFDPARYRLSNLIQENPSIANPVNEFLATKPGDTEAEGRLKNVLENGALGIATTGLMNVFITGLKGLRSVNHLTPKPVDPVEIEALAAKQVQEGTAPLGDPNAPLLVTRDVAPEQAAAGQSAAQESSVRLRRLSAAPSNAEAPTTTINSYPDEVFSPRRGTGNALADEYLVLTDREVIQARYQLLDEASSHSPDEVKAALAALDKYDPPPDKLVVREASPRNSYGRAPDPNRTKLFFEIADENGNRAYMDGKLINGGKTLDVDISEGTGGPNTFGARFREVARQIKEKLPGVENVQGMRVSGARSGAPQAPIVTQSLTRRDPGKDVFVNFARINTPDDVKALLQQTANLHADEIATAQRGVQSQEATKQLADDMGMSVNDLLARRRSPNGARQPFTAEESLAARRLLVASGEKLHELAQRAAGPNAGEIDLFNLRKMMATHQAIQNEVLGARTETARALAAWRIEAGAGQAQLNAIKAMMETAGPDTAKMARELVKLKATGATPAALATYVRKSAVGTIGQGIREVYVNGLLSGPLTHIVNTFGNALTLGLSVVERAVARTISKHVTASDAIAEGEATAMLHGIVEGQRDALRLAWKATGDLPAPDHLGKIDTPRPAAISSTDPGAFGTAVNVLGATTRAPSLLTATADKYFRAVNYRAQLHAFAQRTVASEGLAGKAAAQRYRELIDNPPEHIKINADEAALTNTFNNAAGWFGSNLLKLREAGGPLNATWLVVPFIRTPVNIARYAFERTPLAPLVGQWREAFSRGGADRDMALAKVATGTMVMGLAQAGAANGYVTGALPSDSGEAQLWAREGRQPYSVKVGDSWYSFNRADPFGMTMGFAADIENTLARGEVSPKDVDEWQEVVAGGIAAIANTATDKTFMRGFSQFNDMLSDPERYASQQINSTITGFVPFTALSSWATRLQDPTVKDARTPLDAISARIPGLADRIIPKRTLWGETRTDPAIGYNAFSPLRASEEAPSPIDAELDRLRVYPKSLGWKESVLGTDIDFSDDPKALDEYRRLAGNGWKHPAWGLGLKDFLDQTVSGQGPMSQVYQMYADGTEGGKAAFIKQWITKYREGAARALLDDPKFVGFKAHWEQQREAQHNARARINTGALQ